MEMMLFCKIFITYTYKYIMYYIKTSFGLYKNKHNNMIQHVHLNNIFTCYTVHVYHTFCVTWPTLIVYLELFEKSGFNNNFKELI